MRCEAMCDRAAVLSELNGALDARVMFIGEAPGRKGADRLSGGPGSDDLYGDAGDDIYVIDPNLGTLRLYEDSGTVNGPLDMGGVAALEACSAARRGAACATALDRGRRG